MTHHIALFSFRLSGGRSIGPSALRKLWSSACDSDDVKVSRVTSGQGDTVHTYSLCASPRTANLQAVEIRLRGLLEQTLPSAAINLSCL
jgi:hypothetical protein